MALKTDYQNDKFQGKRKWEVITNADNTISMTDVTIYETEGNIFNADDINATNSQINTNVVGIEKANTVIVANRNELMQSITANKNELVQLRTVTFTVSGWSAVAPYTQTVTIIGMTINDSPTVGILYPANLTETLKANIDKSSNMITKIETVSGGIRIICQFKKPVADIIFGLKGV